MNLPNQLSLLRILLTPLFVFLLFMDSGISRLLSFAVFAVASMTDWYDGYIARKSGKITITGQFLDPLADKILVSSALICFSVMNYFPAWMVLVIVTRDLLMTAFRSYAILKGKPVKTNRLARCKTFIQVIAIYFIYLYHLFARSRFGDPIPGWLAWIPEFNLIFMMMYFVTLLTVFSGVVYLWENRRSLSYFLLAIRRAFLPSNTGMP
jgi:CDP-diacylglycerol--glycerol-3-phosphate 3-phosphatidyltransferase